MAARKSEAGIPRAPVVAVMVAAAMAMLASRAASQNNGCSSVMMTLSPCLDYISGKSPIPEFTCCTTLAGVVQSDPRCLCMVLDGSAASFGISINHTRALELPGVCKVQAPPISQCTAVPTPPPAPDTPTLADEPAETNEDEPSPPPAGSAGSNKKNLKRHKLKESSEFNGHCAHPHLCLVPCLVSIAQVHFRGYSLAHLAAARSYVTLY